MHERYAKKKNPSEIVRCNINSLNRFLIYVRKKKRVYRLRKGVHAINKTNLTPVSTWKPLFQNWVKVKYENVWFVCNQFEWAAYVSESSILLSMLSLARCSTFAKVAYKLLPQHILVRCYIIFIKQSSIHTRLAWFRNQNAPPTF